ncbi:hypothetical protein P9133_32000 [Bacillus thuringiensis]|nr:hypothetical protein [Bacillus thuringiensis]MEC3268942.1 hypothetical protein [Bacillus thuringiensis]MEC3515440.1 hypothetical protein [Bacillus thuringiensis]MED2072297.1 hypothetical protein [Bacillus thuringiensis]MED2223632.1 hypothetical protein [Bacillus thuringiensis]MED2282220.1 hypothetical protein [Bacillus thuringiensis]
MTVKQFEIVIDGEVDNSQIEDCIYQGLQHYEDIEWTSFSVKEVTEEK